MRDYPGVPSRIHLALLGTLLLAIGYVLGTADGREERVMLRRAVAVMEMLPPTPVRQPCPAVYVSVPERTLPLACTPGSSPRPYQGSIYGRTR